MEQSYPNGLKTLWEKEKFLLFPQCFQKACFSGASKGVILWEWVKHTKVYGCMIRVLILMVVWHLIPFQPFPKQALLFTCLCTSLSKTQWQKEKLLVTSNFSFSHYVFYSLRVLSAIFIKLKIVVCKHFHFGRI